VTDSPEARKAQVAQQFSRAAPLYDSAGCFVHFGRRLVETVGVEPGQRVLDVASGRGAVLFPAAERVGPSGHAEGIDLAEGMVAAVNADAERRGLAARVRLMDAEHLDYPDASFDRVLCGFGIMFPPDQLRVLRECQRVLRSGGRIGLSTWQRTDLQDLQAVFAEMRLGYPPGPGWITDPDVLAGLLRQAGFADIQVVADTHTFLRPSPDVYWQDALGSAVRRSIDTLDAEQTIRVRAALAERLKRYRQADGYHVPATALIATASR
jgi:O-methyltransferase/aklanonic acid methyltransferase